MSLTLRIFATWQWHHSSVFVRRCNTGAPGVLVIRNRGT